MILEFQYFRQMRGVGHGPQLHVGYFPVAGMDCGQLGSELRSVLARELADSRKVSKQVSMVCPDSRKMKFLGCLGAIVPGRWACSGAKLADVEDPGACLSPFQDAFEVPSSEYR